MARERAARRHRTGLERCRPAGGPDHPVAGRRFHRRNGRPRRTAGGTGPEPRTRRGAASHRLHEAGPAGRQRTRAASVLRATWRDGHRADQFGQDPRRTR
ncbi:hypothetical protein G6F32_015963 [Rhizopus arrhizus]|nr:hypothetical protein G6F32_015963 [Rhizopus arrhizus]